MTVNGASAGGVRYERSGHVATLTIDRPERRNAMTFETLASLRDGVLRARSDGDVRVLVLTGAGDRAFCAGADLGGVRGDGYDAEQAHAGRGHLAELFQAMWTSGIPTVARVRGYALAGGFGLAMACDIVIAADDAVFGAPEVAVGLWPYMITVPLVRSMPPKVALEENSRSQPGRGDAAQLASRQIGEAPRTASADAGLVHPERLFGAKYADGTFCGDGRHAAAATGEARQLGLSEDRRLTTLCTAANNHLPAGHGIVTVVRGIHASGICSLAIH